MDQAPARRARAIEQPDRPTWCRVQVAVSLTPPATGKVLSLDRGPRTVRVTVHGPKWVLATAALAYLSSHPFAGQAAEWVRRFLGW